MKADRIYYAKPSITTLEQEYVMDAVANGWGDHCYDYIYRFESSFKSYIGSKHAMATSSATGALQLGLAALGIGPGDEVILADTNWVACVAPIIHLGATPVLVDILSDTWCLDPAKVEEAITPRTKAIIAVHLYGNLCNMAQLEKIASANNLYLIEDAAEALGSRWGNIHAGTRGTFGIYSFHGTKTATSGEGGMLVTNDCALYEKVLTLNNHGRTSTETRQFWPSTIGYKFKISNIQAALGCAQIERIEELVNKRRKNFYAYQKTLIKTPDAQMNPEPEGTFNSFWMPTLILPRNLPHGSRDNLLELFRKNNIDARTFFYPLSAMPALNICKSLNTPIAHSVSKQGINLPSYYDLNEQDINRVLDLVKGFIDEHYN